MAHNRIEIYTGWKCNHKCIFCNEQPNIQKGWNTDVTFYDILKKLIRFKKSGSDHVTFLGGEPFIHKALGESLRAAKKLGYTTLVTTNGSILQYQSKALENLKYIDEMIVSVHSINPDSQKRISGSNSYIDFKKVFSNIRENWNGKMLKANMVVNRLNVSELDEILEFLKNEKISEISITYPDFIPNTYGEKYTGEYIIPRYAEAIENIRPFLDKYIDSGINIKLADFPLCTLGDEKLFKLSDDFCYENRLKVTIDGDIQDRNDIGPRNRLHIDKCNGCSYAATCKGPASYYERYYGFDEISPIKI